ncbi:COMM domain-containing protein 8 [Osmerus mordax]|uniref:COMM domain-containing protein 8 n=1 Tax=Osmerus mordax TaxID=8014 RepID=C1BKZ1_OSMMO|nr:COMM domain-containing protein 8 [Osmerus mordax]
MLNLLVKLPPESCPKLLHRVVDGVCGREPPQMADYGDTWSLDQWLQLLDSLSSLFRLAVGKKISNEEVTALLAGMENGYREAVMMVLRARQEEIHQALVERTNSVSSATLQDFDWKMKLALSSDKISSLQTPLLDLHLGVQQNGTRKPVYIEMNREELQMLISSLDAANKVVLQLK